MNLVPDWNTFSVGDGGAAGKPTLDCVFGLDDRECMGKEENPKLPGPLVPLCAFAGAAVFGLLAVPLFTDGQLGKLLASPEYRTWQVILVLQSALWILGGWYVVAAWRCRGDRWRELRALLFPVLLMGVLIVLPGLLTGLLADEPRFTRSDSKAAPCLPLPVIFGVIASLTVAAGLFRIHGIARRWLEENELPKESVYQRADSQLERHLLILGAILAGAVLGADASRKAFGSIDGKYFLPEGEAWFFAIYWSVLLASIYVVPKIAMRKVGYRIRDDIVKANIPEGSNVEAKTDLEKKVNERLGLDQGYIAQLQSAFSIVTPIAGAIASNLLQ